MTWVVERLERSPHESSEDVRNLTSGWYMKHGKRSRRHMILPALSRSQKRTTKFNAESGHSSDCLPPKAAGKSLIKPGKIQSPAYMTMTTRGGGVSPRIFGVLGILGTPLAVFRKCKNT